VSASARMSTPIAAGVLAIYAALVAWLTWPLAASLGTHFPAAGAGVHDTLYMAWALSYESHALVTAPFRLADANIYHPALHALFYGDTGFGALPYFMPVFLLTRNPTLALNLTLLGGIALTAWTLHAVVFRWTGSHLGGFVAAWTLLTSRWVFPTFVSVSPSYAMLQYFPLIVFFTATPLADFRGMLRLLPLVVLQALADVFYVAPAVLGPLVLIALARLPRRATRRAGGRLLAVVGLALIALLPVYGGHLAVRAENPVLAGQSLWTLRQPIPVLPWGPFAGGPTSLPPVTLLLIGAGAVSLAARRGDSGPMRVAWGAGAFWALVGTYLSLGPKVSCFGRVISLPQDLVSPWLPFYRYVRVPIRLGVAGLIGLAILAGVAFAECARRIPDRHRGRAAIARTALAAALAVAAYQGYARMVGDSYRLDPAMTPKAPLIDILRAGMGPIIVLPVATTRASAGNRPPTDFAMPYYHIRAMYESIFHWRPLLNGYSSYWPAGFLERMATASRLPAPEAVASLRREAGLTMVLVHADDFGRFKRESCDTAARLHVSQRSCSHTLGERERGEWLALAGRGGREDLRLVARDGADLLFAVTSDSLPPH